MPLRTDAPELEVDMALHPCILASLNPCIPLVGHITQKKFALVDITLVGHFTY